MPKPPLFARLTTRWRAYWPAYLIVIGLMLLSTSLASDPLNDWLAADTKTGVGDIHATAFDDFMKGWHTAKIDRKLPKNQRATSDLSEYYWFWRLVFKLFLPVAMLLLGSGQYLYRYVVQPTLFSENKGSKMVFWLSTTLIWTVWASLVGTGRLRFSSQSYTYGLDSALPTVVLGVWLTQFAITHFLERRREQRTLVQTARKAEIAALTAQVNPPFIFHALQHLQATAHAEHLPRTEQSLSQLAGIMQYVLEESRKKITDVSREIDFIRDYLRLQELRLPHRDTIRITTSVDWDGKPTPIVPLLLNPLIENAFKYGISMQQACFVDIHLAVKDGVLTFTSANSVLPRTDLEKGTGLGMSNVRKRLQLAYPSLHKLTVSDKSDTYQVTLKIKLC